MPKAMYALLWDDALGPFIGRSYPETEPLSGEEALSIFMGHGVNQEAKIGFTKIRPGLIISYMEAPNCIAVLLDDNEDPTIIERNLRRLIPEIDLTSSDWDSEIKHAYLRFLELIKESSGDELLAKPGVKSLLDDMTAGRIPVLHPKHVLKGIDRYPDAATYLGQDNEEVSRTLRDLENAGELVPKTYGRRTECRQCGSSEASITLLCPQCDSESIHNVYTVFCPKCSEQFQTVIIDDLPDVRCQKCKEAVKVADLNAIDVDPLCNDCGTASDEPKIVLTCAVCGKRFKGADLLGGTGLAYYPKEENS